MIDPKMIRTWPTERLRTYRASMRFPARHSRLRGLCDVFWTFGAPFILYLPLQRAAEVSRTWETVAWLIAALAVGLTALSCRSWDRSERDAEVIDRELEAREDNA